MNVPLTSGPVKLSTMEELLFPVVDFVCVPLPEIGFLALAVQVTLGGGTVVKNPHISGEIGPIIIHWTLGQPWSKR